MSTKVIPSDLQGSPEQWKSDEICRIDELYNKNPDTFNVCHDKVSGTQYSKNKYLERVKELFINCKEPGGKNVTQY